MSMALSYWMGTCDFQHHGLRTWLGWYGKYHVEDLDCLSYFRLFLELMLWQTDYCELASNPCLFA